MKITGVEAFPLVYDLPVARGDGRGLSTRRQTLVIKVSTDEGVHGWGQGGRLDLVRNVFAPLLVGEDPRDSGRLWHRLHHASRDRGAVGGVDMALWDVKGKLAGAPVAQLLGGALRDRVPAYASLHNYTAAADLGEELAAHIRDAKAAGYRALKMKIGGRPVEEDVRCLRLAREAAGPGMALMADANQTYTLPMAVRVGRALEELGFAWFEEPIATQNVPGYVQLCQKLDVAIAGYEGVGDPAAIAPVLEARAVHIYQPDVVLAGGFTVMPHLATLAAAFGVAVTCHSWDTALTHVASLHFLATLPAWQPNGMTPVAPPLEVTTLPRQPLNCDLLLNRPQLAPDGTFAVPAVPGLGVEVNLETLERYDAERTTG